jgi:site-specific DNA recombinase
MPGAALAKAALYLRISTGRQAKSDLSIPDQCRQITAYCLAKGWTSRLNSSSRAKPLRRSAPGVPGHDRRGVGEAADLHRRRRSLLLALLPRSLPVELYVRELAKNGVCSFSITQDLGYDPISVDDASDHDAVRRIVASVLTMAKAEFGRPVSAALSDR